MATEKVLTKGDADAIAVVALESPSDNASGSNVEKAGPESRRPMATKRALIAWLVLCFSTGPTAGMAFRYVPAVLQSAANVLGHIPGTNKPCAERGVIRCVVPFGTGEVDYNSYILYLQSISRASEGVVCIFISGVADFTHNRKNLLILGIVLFGTFALPFASMTSKTYRNLVSGSILWVFMTTVQGIYGTLSSSYIPLFMREAGWIQARTRIGQDGRLVVTEEERATKELFNRGTMVSVLGLLSGNVGSILGQGIGLIIAHTAGSGMMDGYKSFLLAITIAGCLTISFGGMGYVLLPSVKGSKPPTKNYGKLAVTRWIELLKSIPKYPEAFKLCVGWVLWNTGYSNFNSVIGLLFREVSGLGTGDRLYTVYTFMAVTTASIGSLTWMFVFPRTNIKIKTWAYCFLAINIFCIFWGCLGIGKNVKIGYKYVPEFWIEQTLFCMTSSALRSANRVMYASMLPRGREAHFFGLELTLDLATGWINPLVQSVIQDKTHNLRYPMLPNFFLLVAALGFYIWCDLEKGVKDSLKEFDDDAAPAVDDGT
ncbi:autophagy-related protein [Parastagonospora nodorum]|nr:autophagy-related protein [Parastagonospora nodorum]KAH5100017.1 autophagy-related protein [Parastagonospora nodorum]KAH5136830.1 autophagy-related protein [Parastagonospora nodorum]KAH5290840.1 autophagy-related protein [Parastagonospora nodorum]KAH6288523.1 autophagy-related protein [Parastagonospora nodorum]